ncbi:MAG: T9SS type A sorting domain-containing protein [Bacteroidetes bacterium]|nr:T9SS type A sorting domain-containing protein [Bacteroidota bacterium]
MKKLYTIILFALAGTIANAQQNTWTQKANFGDTYRTNAVAFSIGTKGYVGTGWDISNTYKRDLWQYDPTGDTWTQMADIGTSGSLARYEAISFSTATKGYIGMGENISTKFKDLWEYDPTGNTWTQKANYPGNSRIGLVGFSIANLGYAGLGEDTSYNFTTEFYQYNPSGNTWTAKANFTGPGRSDARGFSINGMGYIGPGGGNTALEDFWQYNPNTNSWAQKANFGGGFRTNTVGFSIGTKGFIGTGLYTTNYYSDFWMYDPSLDSWTMMASFPGTARGSAIGFSIGNKGYLGTGENSNTGSRFQDFYMYDAGALSVNEINLDNLISVYPNPTNGKFNLSSEITKGEISIYNMQGEKIYSSIINSNKSEIDLREAPSGIYFLQLKTERGTANKKIVITQ